MAGTTKYEPWEDTDMAVPRDEGNDLDDLVVTVEPPAKTARVGEGDCVSADPVGSIPSRAISPAQSTPIPSIILEPTVMMSHALSSSLDRALQPQPPALQNDSTAELRESNRIMQHMQQMMFEFMKNHDQNRKDYWSNWNSCRSYEACFDSNACGSKYFSTAKRPYGRGPGF